MGAYHLFHYRYNAHTATQEKSLVWVGGCKKDLMALPADVRKFFGHALDFAQRGDQHDAAKVMKGFGGAGVLEVVEVGWGWVLRFLAALAPPNLLLARGRLGGRMRECAKNASFRRRVSGLSVRNTNPPALAGGCSVPETAPTGSC